MACRSYLSARLCASLDQPEGAPPLEPSSRISLRWAKTYWLFWEGAVWRKPGQSCPRLQVPEGFGPRLNVLHRWVETDFFGVCPLGSLPARPVRTSGVHERISRQGVENVASTRISGRGGRSQPAVPLMRNRQTGKSLLWIERLRKSSSRRSMVSSRTPTSWLWLKTLASPSPRCRTCASR